MTGIMQSFVGVSSGYPNGWPANIGDAYGGGFFAGQINVSGTIYNLVVAPKATGESSSKTWGTYGVTTGITSVINGPTNTTSLVALGANYQAAIFCNNLNSGGGLNGYTDWYLPAKNELEVLYYFLKPGTQTNVTSSGANVNAVSPEPYNTNYTTGNPAQTTATGTNGFRTSETNALAATPYWSSSAFDYRSFYQQFDFGTQDYTSSSVGLYVRAVRRIPI